MGERSTSVEARAKTSLEGFIVSIKDHKVTPPPTIASPAVVTKESLFFLHQ